MAKTTPLTLADLNMSLGKADIQMNPAIAAQLKDAVGGTPGGDVQLTKGASVNLEKSLNNLANAIKENTTATKTNTAALNGKGKPSGKDVESQDLSENQLEDRKERDYQTSLLEEIAKNTIPQKAKDGEGPEDSGFKIGGILTAIAVALGVAAGIFLAQLKAFMTVMKLTAKAIAGVGKFLVNLIPESIRTNIINKIKAIKTFFVDMVTKIMINLEYAVNIVKDFFKNRFSNFIIKLQNMFKAVGEYFGAVFNTLKSWGSKVMGAIKAVRTAIVAFFEPIFEAAKVIKQYSSTVGNTVGKVGGFFKGIGDFFSNIGGKLGALGKVFGAVTKIVSKLAYPITLIMGAFDGIMEGIKGFEEGGIVGAIAGFTKGVWNSIVSSFLDLIKDMVSWVLGAFGFDEAEKWLDSFSFTDIFNKFWDGVFSPFKMIQDFFTSLEIPKFDFTIFGKKFEFGPYKIGGGDKPKAAGASKGGDTPAASGDKAAPAPAEDKTPKVAPAKGDANKVYAASAENDAAKNNAGKSGPVTSVVNAPTTVTKQTQNQVIRPPIRNQDSSLSAYHRSRYAT